MILGTGRGFEIAQGRLGPGRLHHCMRAVGIGQAALQHVAVRVQQRRTFGAALHESPLVQAQVAEAWLQLHSAWCVLFVFITCSQASLLYQPRRCLASALPSGPQYRAWSHMGKQRTG